MIYGLYMFGILLNVASSPLHTSERVFVSACHGGSYLPSDAACPIGCFRVAIPVSDNHFQNIGGDVTVRLFKSLRRERSRHSAAVLKIALLLGTMIWVFVCQFSFWQCSWFGGENVLSEFLRTTLDILRILCTKRHQLSVLTD